MLWNSYFRQRKVTLEGNTQSMKRGVSRSCPQGSICGPYIWNLVMDTLLRQLDRQNVICVAYADDLLIMIESNNRVGLKRKGNESMSIVKEWVESVGLKASEDKSVCMLLKGILANTRPPWIWNGSKNLPYKKCTKYLGITISKKMSFLPHFQDMRLRLVKLTGQFKRVLRKRWGPSLAPIRSWWSGLFSAIILYGAEVWYTEIEKTYIKKAIDRCQRTVTYAVLHVYRTVSTEAMQMLLGELPWHLQAVERGIIHTNKKNKHFPVNRYVREDELQGVSLNQK